MHLVDLCESDILSSLYVILHTVVTNIQTPVNSPKAISYPFLSSPRIAFIVAATSGAPFPNASNVTPANLGGKPNFKENNSNPGEKNSSVVELSTEKNNMSNEESKIRCTIGNDELTSEE